MLSLYYFHVLETLLFIELKQMAKSLVHNFYLALVIILTTATATAQHIIEGKIVDAETGNPVPFASVGILGTSKGTSSNLNGEFSLSVTGVVTLKITCIGYESFQISTSENIQSIQLKPNATQLGEVYVLSKAVNPKKVVRKAFNHIADNYIHQPFLQKYFYRHYCKDDSVYGRLIEASVDVWKHYGYRSTQNAAGEKEEIRVTQLRRSLDNTVMAQGHEPISVGNILQADIAGYQTPQHSLHMSFFTDVSNLKVDFDDYRFYFIGITTYDGNEVYEISYDYKKDSLLTTTGSYVTQPRFSGSLFITTRDYAIVKAEELKEYGHSSVHTSAYYRKDNDGYYPYHLIREGETYLSEKSTHSFRIDLISVDMRTDFSEKFSGQVLSREQLLRIPYDSVYWSNNTVLKTTPLEDAIIRDLGGGASLNKQFYLYQQYEMNVRDGGKNGEQKFSWFRNFARGKRALYVFFWSGDFRPYLRELELAKQLNKKYRNDITFIFLSLDDDDAEWQQTLAKYNFYADGIINYRVGSRADALKTFHVKETPAGVMINLNGDVSDWNAKLPSDPMLEKDLKRLIKNSQGQD